MGTKKVPLRVRENGSEKEGLLAIFHQSTLSSSIPAEAPTASPSKILQVNVTDGRAVYRGEIDMDRVKMKLLDDLEDHNDKPKQALRMAGYLLHDTVAQIEPVYTYLDNNTTIQLVIKYQHISHKSGEDDEDAAMKKAWSGILTRIHKNKNDDDDDPNSNNNNNNANDNTNALLQFSTTLGNSINQERRNMAHLRQSMQVVQTDRASWKETADQLSGKWDSEKDTLFHNFATLYNKTRQELAATRTQLRDLQAQLEVSEANNIINNDKGKARAPKRAKKKEISFVDEEEMPDQPDDNDNLFDASMANALASGNRVDINIKKENSSTETSKKKTTKGKRKDASDSDKDDDDSSSSSNGMAKRKKSSKAILTFDDDSDDDSIAKKIRAQIAAGDMNTSSDDDVDNSNNKNNTAII